MPLLTELDLVWGLELQRCRAYGAENCRAKGARAAVDFYGQNFLAGAMSIIMKSKTVLIVSVMVALFVGFSIGEFRATNSWTKYYNHCIHQRYASDVFVYSVALTKLRNGQEKDGMLVLENSLDSSLFALDNNYKSLAKQHDDSIIQAIKTANYYRTKYPWDNPNSFIDTRVKQALSLGQYIR